MVSISTLFQIEMKEGNGSLLGVTSPPHHDMINQGRLLYGCQVPVNEHLLVSHNGGIFMDTSYFGG